MTESALAGMATPPDVIVAANDDMALGAHRGAEGARPRRQGCRSSASMRCRKRWRRSETAALTATIEQLPGGQSRGAVDTLVAFLRDGKKPAEQVMLLTPIAITKDNLDEAERLGEVK